MDPLNGAEASPDTEDVESPWTYNPSVLAVYENFTGIF